MPMIAETLSAQAGAAPAARRGGAGVGLTVESIPESAWDRRVAGFADVCEEQLVSFARRRWPRVALEPLLFATGGRVVGGCLVMVQALPLRTGAIAIAKWGPMLAEAGRADAIALYAAMIEALVARYAQERRMLLSVMAHAAPGGANPQYDYLMARGFRRGAGFDFPDRYIVDLRLADDERRRCFEQKWRYNLGKSERAGLVFEQAGPERLGEFDRLYEAMTDRKKFRDYSAYGTVPALFSREEPLLRPELFLVTAGGEVVSGAIVAKAGQRAVYLYGATSRPGLGLRAGYFLHWQVMRWLRDHTAAAWYDLGGTDGFHGLHQFKKGMVGSAGCISPLPPAANHAAFRLPLLAGEAAFAARGAVHRVQRLLDRLRPERAHPDQRREHAR